MRANIMRFFHLVALMSSLTSSAELQAAEFEIEAGTANVASSEQQTSGQSWRSDAGTILVSATIDGAEVVIQARHKNRSHRFSDDTVFAVYTSNTFTSSFSLGRSGNLVGLNGGVLRVDAQQASLFVVLATRVNSVTQGYRTLDGIKVREIPITVPNITGLVSSPSSAPAGSKFVFTATLDRSLPAGWSVRVDYGAGYLPMNGSGRTFSHRSPAVTRVGSNRPVTARVIDSSGRVRSSRSWRYTVTAVPVPQVERVTSSPSSAPAGSRFTFTAKLDSALPTGWSVRVDYGAGYVSMSGSDRNYSHRSPAVTRIGSNRSIMVQVLDSSDKIRSTGAGRYSVTAVPVPQVQSLTTSPTSAPSGSEFAFSVMLDIDLLSGWSVHVDYGAGFKQMTGAGNSFTHRSLPVFKEGTRAIKVEIRDSNGEPKSTSEGTYVVTTDNERLTEIAKYLNKNNSLRQLGVLDEQHWETGLSRAEAVLLIDTFLGLLNPEYEVAIAGDSSFPDVHPSYLHAEAVARLSAYIGTEDEVAAITKSNELFYPLRVVSRAEFLAILFQGMNYPASVDDADLSSIFLDAEFTEVTSWAESYFSTAYEHGLINGFVEDGRRYLRPFDELNLREALLILASARLKTSLHQHGADGYSDDVSEVRFRSLVGPSIVPVRGFLTLNPIRNLTIAKREVKREGKRCQLLTASSTVDVASGGNAIYRWKTSRGYFIDEPDSNFSEVVLCPSGNSDTDYKVSLEGFDRLGFSASTEVSIASNLFQAPTQNYVSEQDVVFSGWSGLSVASSVAFGETIDIDFSTVGFRKNGVLVGADIALVDLISETGVVVLSARSEAGVASLDTTELENANKNYKVKMILYLNGKKEEMASVDYAQTEVTAAVRVLGSLNSAPEQDDPGTVLVNGVETAVNDGFYSVTVPVGELSGTFEVSVPESSESNYFPNQSVRLANGVNLYRLDFFGSNRVVLPPDDFDNDGIPDGTDDDDDNDGILDTVEVQYGLDQFNPSDASQDLDDDTYNNLTEALAGSALDDANSIPVSTHTYPSSLILNCGSDVLAGGWADCGLAIRPQGNLGASGITLNLHFDSTLVSPSVLPGLYESSLISFDEQPQADSENLDNNASTDQYVSIRWESTGQWLDALGTIELGGIVFDVNKGALVPDTAVFGLSTKAAANYFGAFPVTAGVALRPADSCLGTYLLEPEQWSQISLPCLPTGDTSLQAVFGDDGLGEYFVDWFVWKYATASNEYVRVELQDEMQAGVGYWIAHLDDDMKTLDLPDNSEPSGAASLVACPGNPGLQCYEMDLVLNNRNVSWNKIGLPYDMISNINDWTVQTSNAPCDLACSMDQATAAGMLSPYLYHLRRRVYLTFGTDSVSQPWAGYWLGAVSSITGERAQVFVPVQ